MSSINHVPVQFQAGAAEAARAIKQVDNVLVAAHVNLDGDALGSIAACGHILGSLGKNFALYSSTGVPAYLRFLDLPGPVYTNLASVPFEPQSAIYLDCSDPLRLGSELSPWIGQWTSINIDHHLAPMGLGTLANYVDPGAAATSQLMAYVAMSLDLPIASGLANSIALGIMTDTGGFCHGNTSADVFALCALLMQSGCNMSQLREKLQNNWTLDKLRLWGDLFLHAHILDDGKLAITGVSLENLRTFHCTLEDLEGLVEWIRKIRGIQVAAIVREVGSHECKFSLRSYGPVDVRSMAAELGGGGHFNAAGGTIFLPLDESCQLLAATVASHLSHED